MSKNSEFGFIRHISSLFEHIGDGNIEGIGDDCAIIPFGEQESLVITTDLLTEDIHFLTQAISPEQLGAKALAVNLSDVAAMGARPVASLLSIALPKDCDHQWAVRFIEGYAELSKRYDVALIGGDTSLSQDKVTINVVAIGKASNANIKRRGAAKVGDAIFVVGELGESAAGLKDVLAGNASTNLAKIHHNPKAQILEGQWLGECSEVHAMIDLSDGLASDLTHILDLSRVDAQVEINDIPAPCGIENAVCGGEDYKLLFTVDSSASEDAEADFIARFEAEFQGQHLYKIGHIIEQKGLTAQIHWTDNALPLEKDWRGFTHF